MDPMLSSFRCVPHNLAVSQAQSLKVYFLNYDGTQPCIIHSEWHIVSIGISGGLRTYRLHVQLHWTFHPLDVCHLISLFLKPSPLKVYFFNYDGTQPCIVHSEWHISVLVFLED